MTGFPAELTPLAAAVAGEPNIADAFELRIAGMEIAMGYRCKLQRSWLAGGCGWGVPRPDSMEGGEPAWRAALGMTPAALRHP